MLLPLCEDGIEDILIVASESEVDIALRPNINGSAAEYPVKYPVVDIYFRDNTFWVSIEAALLLSSQYCCSEFLAW